MNRQEILHNINSLLNEVDSPESPKFSQLKANCFQLGMSVKWAIEEFKKNREIK